MTTAIAKYDSKSAADILARAQALGLECEELRVLKEGDVIEGTCTGRGAPHDVEDKATGQVRAVPTYRIKLESGIMLRVLGSHQIDAKLGAGTDAGMCPFPVILAHAGQVNTARGMRVNDVKIFMPEIPTK